MIFGNDGSYRKGAVPGVMVEISALALLTVSPAMIIPSLCCLQFHLDDGSKSGLLMLLGWKMFARYLLASYVDIF